MSIWETFLIVAMAKDGEPGEAGCASFPAITWSVRLAPRPPPASMWQAAFSRHGQCLSITSGYGEYGEYGALYAEI